MSNPAPDPVPMKILIATPAFGGMVTTEYMGSLLKTLIWCASNNIVAELMTLNNESLISRARNRCATYALDNKYDKLFFIDADMVWEPFDFANVLKSDKPIIGGTYPMKSYPVTLNFNMKEEDAERFEQYRSPRGYTEFIERTKKEEFEVRHIPTGFMMIDSSVLKKLTEVVPSYIGYNAVTDEKAKFYDFFPVRVNGEDYESEDWAFCSIAKENGFPIYLQTRVILKHTGQHNYSL